MSEAVLVATDAAEDDRARQEAAELFFKGLKQFLDRRNRREGTKEAFRHNSYSMINQLGFMVCGVGLGTALALNGAVSHAFNDVLFKGLLFMAMGAMEKAQSFEQVGV